MNCSVAMHTLSDSRINHALHPFPEGWYLVATRDEIQREQLLEKHWMGEQVVAWCDDEGRISVSDAYCPHLGSHLGPEAGGRVYDGKLVCPFHGFEFDIGGQCVATPSAAPPRSARLELYETRELAGMIFAWYGTAGRAPQWDLPLEEPEQDGWSGLSFYSTRLRGHPQETTENAIDLSHLSYVHGFSEVTQLGPVDFDAHVMRTNFEFNHAVRVGGLPLGTFDIAAAVSVYGLGYSFVEVHERNIDMRTRLFTLATPTDGEEIELTLASQVRRIEHPQRRLIGMAFLPVWLRTRIMNWFALSLEALGVRQDNVIWSRKRYRARPRLCRSDGEIMAYRAWCAQFYPDAESDEAGGSTLRLAADPVDTTLAAGG